MTAVTLLRVMYFHPWITLIHWCKYNHSGSGPNKWALQKRLERADVGKRMGESEISERPPVMTTPEVFVLPSLMQSLVEVQQLREWV